MASRSVTSLAENLFEKHGKDAAAVAAIQVDKCWERGWKVEENKWRLVIDEIHKLQESTPSNKCSEYRPFELPFEV